MDHSAAGQPAPAPRRAVASYTNYRDAERAVDWLSDQGFPVERVAIVGTGLRYVEQVAGRVTTGRAALIGAGQGLLIVLLFALVAGAIFGAIFGGLAHYARGGQRDFTSVSGTEAERYELMVDDEVAGEAQRLLEAISARSR